MLFFIFLSLEVGRKKKSINKIALGNNFVISEISK